MLDFSLHRHVQVRRDREAAPRRAVAVDHRRLVRRTITAEIESLPLRQHAFTLLRKLHNPGARTLIAFPKLLPHAHPIHVAEHRHVALHLVVRPLRFLLLRLDLGRIHVQNHFLRLLPQTFRRQLAIHALHPLRPRPPLPAQPVPHRPRIGHRLQSQPLQHLVLAPQLPQVLQPPSPGMQHPHQGLHKLMRLIPSSRLRTFQNPVYLLPHACRSRQLLQHHQPAQTGQPLRAPFQLDG